ncbi:hypothetical protein AVEN_154829-1 [Araneus ventricosus]|uniref:Uncharacterized protein n=1 Tax=Araneus ventricosus TaxID=182803 RepID=A0A4Y2BV41_ARAVE|nr:hypothetical protein AVEN_154829-1 [Araneus ventricosus]
MLHAKSKAHSARAYPTGCKALTGRRGRKLTEGRTTATQPRAGKAQAEPKNQDRMDPDIKELTSHTTKPHAEPLKLQAVQPSPENRSGMVRMFGEGVPTQVSSSSPDSGSKLRGPSQNSPRVVSKRDVNITKLKLNNVAIGTDLLMAVTSAAN